jgi:PAS domain S-box-containing protein
MLSKLIENPNLFRHLVEDLPMGIYIVDGERRIRFWNHGAEYLTGYFSHEVVGLLLEDAVQACDRRGNSLIGERCPVTLTLSQRHAQQSTAFYLHKKGHRTAVRIRTHPILESERAGSTDLLSAQLGKVPNCISIEGHTDAEPFSGKGIYTIGNFRLTVLMRRGD